MRESHVAKAKAGMCHFLAEQDAFALSLSHVDISLSIRYYKQLSIETLISREMAAGSPVRFLLAALPPLISRDESRQLLNAGYDGLYYDDPDNIVSCGCLASDLYACGERQPECKPGYRVPSSEKLGDHDWYISPEKKLLSPDNYYTHKWRTFTTPSTPDSPPETVRMCETCGIEDIGSPEEFDINYPPCEPV